MSVALGSHDILLHYFFSKIIDSFLFLRFFCIVFYLFFDRCGVDLHRHVVILKFDVQIVLGCSGFPIWRWLGLARPFRLLLLLRALIAFFIVIHPDRFFLLCIMDALLTLIVTFLLGQLSQNRLCLLLIETRAHHGAVLASHSRHVHMLSKFLFALIFLELLG